MGDLIPLNVVRLNRSGKPLRFLTDAQVRAFICVLASCWATPLRAVRIGKSTRVAHDSPTASRRSVDALAIMGLVEIDGAYARVPVPDAERYCAHCQYIRASVDKTIAVLKGEAAHG